MNMHKMCSPSNGCFWGEILVDVPAESLAESEPEKV